MGQMPQMPGVSQSGVNPNGNVLMQVADLLLFAIYGATSVSLNGAALGALISITYAWSVKDEELSSSPPRGRGSMGCQ